LHLKECSGFRWDPVSRTVTIPEAVAEAYFTKHKAIRKFRERGIDNEALLDELFSGKVLIGRY